MAKGLGKGINALFNQVEVNKEDTVQDVMIKEVRPNPYQPRKHFDSVALEELKQSIVQHGVLQPIIVRKTIKGYEIVAGERRFRASQLAKKQTIPAVIRSFDEKQMMELALLENLQREDLSPIEEATAYRMLIEKLDVTQEQLAKRLGKSRPHIANHVRLLSLPAEIQQLISVGQLTMGHGRALIGCHDKQKIMPLAQKIVAENLNVRQAEKLVQQINDNVPRETKKKTEQKNIFIKAQEALLRERFGTTVSIKKTSKRGKIEIEFFSDEDLNRILEMLDNEA